MHDDDRQPGGANAEGGRATADERRSVAPSGAFLPESMWEVARRPRWIGMLVFALALAALFAFLGHWQLDRSVLSLKPASTGSETRKVLSDVTAPAKPFLDKLTGQRVSVTGHFDADDFRVIGDRLQHDDSGYWLVGRFVDSANQASLIVALGWSKTADGARQAESAMPTDAESVTLDGRYLSTESSEDGKYQQGLETVVSVPQLINEWSDFQGEVYRGYVVDGRGWGGLTAIYSPPPIDKATLNWLNVFYAVEWVVFAGFALFLWYRLVRDAFERETEGEDDDLASVDAESAASGARLGRD